MVENTGAAKPKKRGTSISEQIKESIKDELRAEILGEIAAQFGVPVTEEGTIENIARQLAKSQSKTFETKNPVMDGYTWELRKGDKLMRVRRRMNGSKYSEYAGRLSKHKHARELFEKAKIDGTIEYR